MKKYLSLVLIIGLFSFSGCKLIPNSTKGDLSDVENKGRTKVENVETKLASNLANRMDQVSTLAFGTGYALRKIENPDKEVQVAKDLNDRVMSVAGSPSLEKLKEMQITIDNLVSVIDRERVEGKNQLTAKDNEITKLQSETKYLSDVKDAEIRKYMALAQDIAGRADKYKTDLDEYQGWYGLKAIGKGAWQFIKSSMWILGIGSILFLLLRLASMSNPIAASVFSIFNIMGSWFVNGIKVIFPKALEMAGNTATSVFASYKGTMTKMIDGIQTLKDRQKAYGNLNKKYTLDELLSELSDVMGDDDKKRIKEIKTELGYN